tara:strand:+ start:102 stop:431 length:330 start_codon:yes stop_codon:yes gene_type:complete
MNKARVALDAAGMDETIVQLSLDRSERGEWLIVGQYANVPNPFHNIARKSEDAIGYNLLVSYFLGRQEWVKATNEQREAAFAANVHPQLFGRWLTNNTATNLFERTATR